MADRLKIDGSSLRDGVGIIAAAVDAFDKTGELSSELATAVGGDQCPMLPGVIRSAAEDWSVHRKRLRETLSALGDQLANCLEVFGETDKEMAKGMTPTTCEAPR